MTTTSTVRTIRCVGCGRRARFLTPHGVMCPTDALLAVVLQSSTPPDDWMPILIGELDDGFRSVAKPPSEMTA
jgi:hypothetical protein